MLVGHKRLRAPNARRGAMRMQRVGVFQSTEIIAMGWVEGLIPFSIQIRPNARALRGARFARSSATRPFSVRPGNLLL
jgi:hypothetical protein